MRRFLGRAVLAATFLTLVSKLASNAAEIGTGINYIWWRFTEISRDECTVKGTPCSIGSWILPAYRDPETPVT